MFLIFAPFLFIFPKSLKQQDDNFDNEDKAENAESAKPLIQNETDKEEQFSIRSIPRNAMILFRNTVFLCLVFKTSCTEAYFLAGYFSFFPKYLESMFLQSTQVANFVSGFANPIPCAVGTFAGGWLMSKFKWSQSQAMMHSCICTLLAAIGMALITMLDCNNSELNGLESRNATSLCGCDQCPMTFEPICLSNGQSFVSPCHAGCSMGNVRIVNFFIQIVLT